MKLHLPKSLLALTLACFSAASSYTLAAETISVNYIRSDDTKISTQQGTFLGVDASTWNDIKLEDSALTRTDAVTSTNGTAYNLTTQTGRGTWYTNADTSTLEGRFLKDYLDLSNSGGNQTWNISLKTDYMFSELSIYLAGDGDTAADTPPQFSPVTINGTHYLGGTNNSTKDTAVTWGSRDKTASTLSDDNTVTVTLTGGSITAQNVVNADARATLAGFQLVDKTADVLWVATSTENGYTYSRGDATNKTPTDVLAAENTYLGFSGGQDIDFGKSGTTLDGIQASTGTDSNTVVVSGANLNIGTLHAKDGATLEMAGTLASTTDLIVGGLGTVKFTANQSVHNLTLGSDLHLADSTTLTVSGTFYNSGGTIHSTATDAELAPLLTLSGGSSNSLTDTQTSGHLKLAGNCTFNVTTDATMDRVSLQQENWTGNVVVSARDISALDLNTIGNANSTITFKGALGHLNNASAEGGVTYAANIVLENTGNWAGVEFNDGYTNDVRIFSGSVSGSGNLVRNGDGGEDTFKFTGDVSGWTGKFDHAAGNTTNLDLSEGATTINNDFYNRGGTLNVTITGADTISDTSSFTNDSAGSTLNVTITDTKTINTYFFGNQGTLNLTISGNSDTDVTSGIRGNAAVTYTGDGLKTVYSVIGNGNKQSTYNGTTTIAGGTVKITGSKSLGDSSGVTVQSGAKLEVATTSIDLWGATKAITIEDGATLALDNATELAGSLNLQNGSTLDLTNYTGTTRSVSETTELVTLVSTQGGTGTISVGNEVAVTGLGSGVAATLTAENNVLTLTQLENLNITGVDSYADGVLTFKINQAISNLSGNVTLDLADGLTWGNIGNQYLAAGGSWDEMLQVSLINSNDELIYIAGVTSLTFNNYSGEPGAKVSEDGYKIGSYADYMVPEPTTATLSLLALAGLCARRRRK